MPKLLTLFLGLVIIFPCQSFSQEPYQQARLVIAKQWLSVIGVNYQSEIGPDTAMQLQEALESWRKGTVPKHEVAAPELRTQPKPAGNYPEDRGKSTTPTDVRTSDQEHLNLDYLFPGIVKRMLRVTSFSAEFLRTPNYVAVQQGSQTVIAPNPDHGLLSLGGTLNFAELYISPDLRASACEIIAKETSDGTGKPVDTSGKQPLDRCKNPAYLAGTNRSELWGRFATATTIKVLVSEVPRIEAGVNISSIPGASNIKWTPTITGTFDPTVFFHTAADWKTIGAHYQKLLSSGLIDEDNKTFFEHVLPTACRADSPGAKVGFDKCYDALLGPSHIKLLFMSIVPTVDVKAYTPFDYVKIAPTTLVEPPSSGKTIYDVTLSWDLHRLFPSTTDRVNALTAYQGLISHSDPPLNKRANTSADDGDWKRRIEALYVELSQTPSICKDQAWWTHFRSVVLKEN
jgi:hypothetical protein